MSKAKEKLALIKRYTDMQQEAWLQQLSSFIPDMKEARPTPKQIKFFSDPAYLILLRAGNRTGKTFSTTRDLSWKLTRTHPYRPEYNASHLNSVKSWGSVDIFDAYLRTEPKVFWALGPDYDFVNDTLWGMYLKKFIPSWYYMDEDGKEMISYTQQGNIDTITFKNGDILQFKTYSQRLLSLMGRKVDEIMIDEMPDNLQLITELMMRLQDTNGTLVMGFTPLVTCPDIKTVLEGHPLISQHIWTVADNPLYRDNPEKMERYLRDLAHLPPNERLARLQGDWYYELTDLYVFEGLAPTEVPDFEVPITWRRVRALDPSTHTNGYVEMVEDPNTRNEKGECDWYVVSSVELSWKDKVSVEILVPEVTKLKPHAMQDYALSIYDNAESWFGAYSEAMKDGWIPCILKNKENLIMNLRVVASNGRIKFFKNGASGVLSQIRSYRKRDTGSIIKKDDHMLDALMYLCMQLPKAEGPPPLRVTMHQEMVMHTMRECLTPKEPENTMRYKGKRTLGRSLR